jgi:hypothetical protein
MTDAMQAAVSLQEGNSPHATGYTAAMALMTRWIGQQVLHLRATTAADHQCLRTLTAGVLGKEIESRGLLRRGSMRVALMSLVLVMMGTMPLRTLMMW